MIRKRMLLEPSISGVHMMCFTLMPSLLPPIYCPFLWNLSLVKREITLWFDNGNWFLNLTIDFRYGEWVTWSTDLKRRFWQSLRSSSPMLFPVLQSLESWVSSALSDSWEKISVASLLNESKLFYVREVGWFSRSAVIVIFAYWIWVFMMRGENSCLD